MSLKVYELQPGIFCTTEGTPETFNRFWNVTGEQAQLIENCANLFVENGELVIEYTIDIDSNTILNYAEIVPAP